MNNARKLWPLIILLAGCRPDADTTLGVSPQSRIRVTRIGVFEDGIAYENRRGIYLITDTKTGKEYLGVSGIGISELGEHSIGRQKSEDER